MDTPFYNAMQTTAACDAIIEARDQLGVSTHDMLDTIVRRFGFRLSDPMTEVERAAHDLDPTKRYVAVELLDHVSDAEATEFADEITRTFQPHFDARVVGTTALDPEPKITGVERIDSPRVHVFATTRDAYTASQTSDGIIHGDVLVATEERAVAVMIDAWPCAPFALHAGEQFHTAADDLDFNCVESVNPDRGLTDLSLSRTLASRMLNTIASGETLALPFIIIDCATGEDRFAGYAPTAVDALNAYMDEQQIARYARDGEDPDHDGPPLFYEMNDGSLDVTFSNTQLHVAESTDEHVAQAMRDLS